MKKQRLVVIGNGMAGGFDLVHQPDRHTRQAHRRPLCQAADPVKKNEQRHLGLGKTALKGEYDKILDEKVTLKAAYDKLQADIKSQSGKR